MASWWWWGTSKKKENPHDSNENKTPAQCINYVDRLPTVLTRTILLTYCTFEDRWTASSICRQWYITFCSDSKPWLSAITEIYNINHISGFQTIYEDDLSVCLKGIPPPLKYIQLSSSASSSLSSSSSSSSTLSSPSSASSSSLGRGGQQMIEYCPWRYQWYCLSRRGASMSISNRDMGDIKACKIVVAGAIGSGKSTLTARFISGMLVWIHLVVFFLSQYLMLIDSFVY
jgi:hypothetical protein